MNSSAAASTCAPASSVLASYHLAGGGGSASLPPSPRSLRVLMVTGRSPAPPPASPLAPAAPLLCFLPLALCWGCVGSWGACEAIGWEPGSAGSGQLAAGGADRGEGGVCALEANWRGRCPALLALGGQQFSFSDSSSDCGAGAEILGMGLKGIFLVWKQYRGTSACFTFSYFYLPHVDSPCPGIVPLSPG